MYNTTKQTLLLSGDVELNPGPLTDNTINDVCFYNNSDFTLRYRMLRHGLIPLDVGGEGDCFFRSVFRSNTKRDRAAYMRQYRKLNN